MPKFKVGQEVIFTYGNLKDVRGVVHNPYWQISQSDWPEVIVDYNDGEVTRRIPVDIDKVRPAVDPYEYAIHREDLDGNVLPVVGNYWGEKVERKQALEGFLGFDTPSRVKYKLVKRLKVGPILDADDQKG